MIKSIEFVNSLGESLEIDLRAPEQTGLWVKSIKGIGPGKANINTTDLASSDGGIYNSARSEIRNITLTLGIIKVGSESVETIRRRAYKWFGKKNPIIFIIHTDSVNFFTNGYIESNEPDIFNKQETMAISIICPDPNFYNADGTDGVSFSSTVSTFEFPMAFMVTSDTSFVEYKLYYEKETIEEVDYYWLTTDTEMIPGKTYYEEDPVGGFSNEITPAQSEEDDGFSVTSDAEFIKGKEYFEKEEIVISGQSANYYALTSDSEMAVGKTYYEYENKVIFANILDIPLQSFEYTGEVEVGISINIEVHDEVSGLKIFKIYEDHNEVIEITDSLLPDGGIFAGDIINICTVIGMKSAVLIRNNHSYNIMNALGKYPVWFILNKGTNVFTYTADSGESFIDLTLSWNTAYEGI